MISTFDSIKGFLKEIDTQLDQNQKIFLYAIGGIALMQRGLRTVTKDIDLIVESEEEYNLLRRILQQLRFIETKPEFGYDHFNLSQILIRKDFRIDLFSKIVCRGFSLTAEMMQRAERVVALPRLKFFLCSNEDLFLFKTMTERDGDLDDCIALAGMGLNWKVILEELQRQIKTSGNKVWITWVGERLDILQEKGLYIPIMKQVDMLREEYFNEWEKKKR